MNVQSQSLKSPIFQNITSWVLCPFQISNSKLKQQEEMWGFTHEWQILCYEGTLRTYPSNNLSFNTPGLIRYKTSREGERKEMEMLRVQERRGGETTKDEIPPNLPVRLCQRNNREFFRSRTLLALRWAQVGDLNVLSLPRIQES